MKRSTAPKLSTRHSGAVSSRLRLNADRLGPVDLAAREDGQHLEEVHGDDADGHA